MAWACINKRVMVIEVPWKRRRGNPNEAIAVFCGYICSNDMPLTIGPTNRENTFM